MIQLFSFKNYMKIVYIELETNVGNHQAGFPKCD